jgi:hypothetical protein
MDRAKTLTHLLFALLLAVLMIILFIMASRSVFTSGFIGIAQAVVSGFGLGLIAIISRRRRPSLLWIFILLGALIGAGFAIYHAREITLHSRYYWNPWALFVLPLSATCGSVVGSLKFVNDIVDQM